MMIASLILNLIVLIPVCLGLIGDAERMQKTAGPFTPARGILLAMYSTIAILSAGLLIIQKPAFIFVLLLMQIIYKVLTPLTVKTIKNPIVISNLLIALFHMITVYVMFSADAINV